MTEVLAHYFLDAVAVSTAKVREAPEAMFPSIDLSDVIEKQKKWDAWAMEKDKWIMEQRRRRVESRDKSIPDLKDFYAGRSLLVTGGTGFVGKVLIEKLLRSVPKLKTIYAVVRTKKNQSPAERMAEILDLDLFDIVRRDCPEALKKVVAIAGDMSAKGIGLSEESKALLQREVSVVIHGAASVRFDDPLRQAIFLNTRGTHEIIELSKGMKNLKAFVHVSTTYCNTNQPITMEKVYPTPFDWRKVIKIAEENSLEHLQALTRKILGYQPNTYTFTKQLSEKIVEDAHNQMPGCVIIRPSVVAGIHVEPLPGWIDNLYGASAFGVGHLKGILRAMYTNKDLKLNYVNVDVVAKSLIISGWLAGTNQRISDDPSALDVINMSGEDVIDANNYDYSRVVDLLIPTLRPKSLLAPRTHMTSSIYVYHYKMYIQLLFALLVDLFLKLSGQKPLVTKLTRKIYHANMSIAYFSMNNFKNSTENLWKAVTYIDDPDFYQSTRTDLIKSTHIQVNYIFKHLLKEEKAGPYHHTILEVLQFFLQALEYCLYAWVGWTLGSYLVHRGSSYFNNLQPIGPF